MEETHYYPFGLVMAGISSEAAKGITYPTNKKKYNGIEETRELGLNQYDAQLRVLDPQIGIWWQVDPETENMEMWSPYASNYDNPILYKDPLGNEPECCGGFLDALADVGNNIMASASGMLFGALNTISGGVISTDPFGTKRTLTSEQNMYWDNGVMVMQAAQFMPILGGGRRPVTATPEFVPVKVLINPNVKLRGPSSQEVRNSSQMQGQQKGGGKNTQHANQKAREAAKQKYESVKENYNELKSKANKTKEDKAAEAKAKKEMDHQKKKMDNTGENHSRKAKT